MHSRHHVLRCVQEGSVTPKTASQYLDAVENAENPSGNLAALVASTVGLAMFATDHSLSMHWITITLIAATVTGALTYVGTCINAWHMLREAEQAFDLEVHAFDTRYGDRNVVLPLRRD